MGDISWFINIDGHDESGKSSILKEINIQSNFKHTVIDRSFLSTIVYNIKYNRKYDRFMYLNQLIAISSIVPTCLVLCYTDFDTFISRYKNDNKKDMKYAEDDIRLRDEFERDKALFDSCATVISDKCPVIKVDTSSSTINESVSKILASLDLLDGETR